MEYQQLKVLKANEAPSIVYNPPLNLMTGRNGDRHAGSRLAADDSMRVVVFTGGVEGIFITHFNIYELSVLSSLDMPAEPPKATDTPITSCSNACKTCRSPSSPQLTAGAAAASSSSRYLQSANHGHRRLWHRPAGGGVGVLPEAAAPNACRKAIGYARALEMMLLGEVVGAEEAERMGLMHWAVPPSTTCMPYYALAQRLAGGAPIAGTDEALRLPGPRPAAPGRAAGEPRSIHPDAGQRRRPREAMQAYLRGELYEFKGR